MIDPNRLDIGKKVVYKPKHGREEEGIITSITTNFIFVRYANENCSKGTSRKDLFWKEGE